MAEEELVFQLLDEERKARTKRIASEKRITTEDSLVIGVLRLNRELDALYERIDSNFRWTIALILGMWGTMLAILIPMLLKISGM